MMDWVAKERVMMSRDARQSRAPETEVDVAVAGRSLDRPIVQLRIWGTETVYRLPPPPVVHWTIGAAETAEIQLHDATCCVSRRHAQIFREDDHWVLRDLDSKNGSWVDGARCSEVALDPGAEVRLGRITLIAESPRTVALRQFLSRLLGWGQEELADVDRALQSIRLGLTRRVPMAVCGEGDLTWIALALHRRVLGPGRPFIVCDPRRRRTDATVRSAANCETGLLAVAAAAGGSLCLSSRRLPADFDELVASVRHPQTRVRLVFCVQDPEDFEPLWLAPIAVPPLAGRAHELDRIIDEYTQDAFVELGLPPASLGPADHDWVRSEVSASLPQIEKATKRLVALRATSSVPQAAARLGMAGVSLARWIDRRKVPMGAGTVAAPGSSPSLASARPQRRGVPRGRRRAI
jgi:pSer/pThr/pTyr-binding forkhead associated (FHA) protein